MNDRLHVFDSQAGKGDGLCVDVCPHGVIEMGGEIPAPIGFPPHTTEVLIIDEISALQFLLEFLVNHYDGLHKSFSNPISRMFIHLATGAEIYGELRNHVLGFASKANEDYR